MIAYAVESSRKSAITIHNSLGETVTSDDLEQLLAFCLTPHVGQFRCFADLNDSASPLLAKLPIANIKELLKVNRTQYGQFTLIYFKDKVLTVFSGRQYAAYYNLAQYLPNLEGLELEEVAKRGTDFVSELWDIGIRPDKLSSPITAISPILEKLQLSTWESVPDEAGEFFWESSGRAWVESHKLGWFPKVYSADLHAAYGSILANLYDLKDCGTWYHQKEVPRGCTYGVAYGKMSIKSDVSAISYVDGQGHVFNPKGVWSSFFCLPEINYVQDCAVGSFVPSDGWWWVANKRKVQKLHMLVWKMYRDRAKSPTLNAFLKRAIAGIAGKFLETFPDEGFGRLFNPVYGAHVQSSIRCEVGKFIAENSLEKELVNVNTDGLLSTKEIIVAKDDRMGKWRSEGSGEALIVSDSLAFFGDKKPNQITLQEALALIKEHPNSYQWSMRKSRRLTLGDISMGNFSNLGKKLSIGVGFSIPSPDEHDRIFEIAPLNGRDLLNHTYDSKPIPVSRLSKPPQVAIKHEQL